MAVNNYKIDEEKKKFSWKSLGRILTYLKPYKKDFILAIIVGLISSGMLLIIPKIMTYAIDVSFVEKNFLEIVILAVLMLGVILFSILLSKVRRYKVDTILNKVAYDLKLDLFSKLQYLPISYFDTKSHGKIYTRVATYPDEVSIILCYVLLEMTLDMINLIFVVIFMLSSNVKLSLISISLAFILIIFFMLVAPKSRKLQHTVNDKNSNINAFVSESIHGIRITQSFNREKENENILKALEKDRIDAQKRTLYLGNLNWSLTGICNYLSMIFIYYIGLRYFYPAISIGVIIAVDSYSSRFWEPISYIMSSYDEIMYASTYLERIFELLDEPLKLENSKSAKVLDIKGDIILRNVGFSYDDKTEVLKDLNIEIKKGEKVGLVGETGCGKSTILSLISRFYDCSTGEVLIDGVNVKDIRLNCLRGNVSMMLQDNFLFARSVFDNLVLDKKFRKDEVIRVCKKLDIHDMIMKLEKGYDTILLNNGSNLSSGERQLLCIARIILQNPKILILDEATSNIDLMTEKKLQKALQIVMRGRTTIMVAHRISTIQDCDKIILIKNHKNYEEGTHAQLMAKKGEYYKLYTLQSRL